MKPRKPILLSVRLTDQVRERIRYLYYSLSTEKVYLYWVKFFIRWHGMRHPREMGGRELEAFLTMLATERKVSASTHNQALSALLFLYREVLDIDLPCKQGSGLLLSHLMFMIFLIFLRNMIIKDLTPYVLLERMLN